jgi:hypothetical protein
MVQSLLVPENGLGRKRARAGSSRLARHFNPNSEDIMITSKVDRRSDMHRNSQGERFDEAVIREGIMLQLSLNTVSAIEFLKNRGVGAATIQRVLSGHQLRLGDKNAIGVHTS